MGVSANNQNAVPDYAVSATNSTSRMLGLQLGARYTFAEAKDQKGFTMGLSYSKCFLFDRKVANTAWDGGGPDTPFQPNGGTVQRGLRRLLPWQGGHPWTSTGVRDLKLLCCSTARGSSLPAHTKA